MRKVTLLVSALIALVGLQAQAEPTATPAAAGKSDIKKSGFTVGVQFYVDSAGAVTKATVMESDEPVLNEFALVAANSGRLNPAPLPVPGSEPKLVSSQLFFPVEDYDSRKPLPVGVVMPKPRLQPCPQYPFEYRKKNITGGVRLSITIDEYGTVTSANVIKASHPEFSRAAQAAVFKWLFRPATLNGKPVEVTINVSISFELEGRPHGWTWYVAPAPSLSGFIVTTDPDIGN